MAVADWQGSGFHLVAAPSQQGQAGCLGDPRLSVIQRQALADRIGQAQGNSYLQHWLAFVLQNQTFAGNAVQRDRAAGVTTQPANGQVTIKDVQTEEYSVTGSTLAEAAQQLDPEEWGRCTYSFDYTYEATNGRVTKVDIALQLTIRLPRWQGLGWDQASPNIRTEWVRMLAALRSHENQHADIARRWAPRLKTRLLGQQEGRIEQRYNQTLRRVDRETEQFDTRTRHGQAQGVTLDTRIQ